MAASNMPIDFKEMAKAYERAFGSDHNVSGDAMKGFRFHESDIACIKLSVKALQWVPAECTEETDSRTTAGATPSLKTTETLKVQGEVKITEGLCTGVLSQVELKPPAGVNPENKVSLDPCDSGCQSQDRPTTITASSTPSFGAASTAMVSIQKLTYDGHFSCNVYPNGHIGYEGVVRNKPVGGSIKLQELMRKLMEDRERPSCAKNLFKDGDGKYYFVMRGTYKFHHNKEVAYEWPAA